MIDALIDKRDNSEVIRDQIALILAHETASQQQLAVEAGKDPKDWKFRVFLERSHPFEQWLNVGSRSELDTSPIVNVSFDSSSVNNGSSNVVEEQEFEGTFNIDCYAYGEASNTDGGHSSGDEESAIELQKLVRLVRNILMASFYAYLDLRKVVGSRSTNAITLFKPQFGESTVQNVSGGRISFSVRYVEFSPQYTPVNLDIVSVIVERAEDGEVIIEADYDYTNQ